MTSYRFELAKFRPSRVILDARHFVSFSAMLAERRYRAERYARRNHTCGKRAVFGAQP